MVTQTVSHVCYTLTSSRTECSRDSGKSSPIYTWTKPQHATHTTARQLLHQLLLQLKYALDPKWSELKGPSLVCAQQFVLLLPVHANAGGSVFYFLRYFRTVGADPVVRLYITVICFQLIVIFRIEAKENLDCQRQWMNENWLPDPAILS